jgi:hypothetical protein
MPANFLGVLPIKGTSYITLIGKKLQLHSPPSVTPTLHPRDKEGRKEEGREGVSSCISKI